jgi:hypothetical protein
VAANDPLLQEEGSGRQFRLGAYWLDKIGTILIWQATRQGSGYAGSDGVKAPPRTGTPWGSLAASEDRQMLDYAIAKGEGGCVLAALTRAVREIETALDKTPPRDLGFRDFVLMQKHSVAPNSFN